MSAGCDKDAVKAAGVADDKEAAMTCVAIRNGRSTLMATTPQTLARIDSNKIRWRPGLAFSENNADKLKVATVKGITLHRDHCRRHLFRARCFT